MSKSDLSLTFAINESILEMYESSVLGRKESPELSPEQTRATIQQFQSLPIARKKLLAQLMKNSCSYCEQEFQVPNVGMSHGICKRHAAEMWKKMGIQQTKPYSGKSVDLAELSPEERELAVNLFAIVKTKSSFFRKYAQKH